MAQVKKYTHLFFDLDHTLWDFDTNSRIALEKLFTQYDLQNTLNTSSSEFIEVYRKINDKMWERYRQGKVDKTTLRKERFGRTFSEFGHTDESLSDAFDSEYLQISPYQTALIPYTLQVLEYLQPRYTLHIITNGFTSTQQTKLENSGLLPYFREIISSEAVGVNKPHAPIFIEALRRAGAQRKESLMIGDNLKADILGARNCGIDQVYFNPSGKKHSERLTFEIREMRELQGLL